MDSTPMANRISISFFGKRNAGKSSLINALTGQKVAVTSDVAGTTTDPVYKTMELLPLGPVVFIDTPGLDDEGELGSLRVEKTYEVLRKTNLAILVAGAREGITDFEKDFARELKGRKIPCVGVINKSDLAAVPPEKLAEYGNALGIPMVSASAETGDGIGRIKEMIIQNAKFDDAELGLVGDLIQPGDIAVLVTPIDKAAPKGRLILPQQQVIRDIIECDATAMVTKEHELRQTLDSLKRKPAIVITDSQAFLKVSADTPQEIPLTSFSILFARQKGDLAQMVQGIRKIENLKPGGRVLIAEGCTHHRQSDDIGKVKIPRWIRQIVGGDIQFEWASGACFPRDVDR
ncbi:MAG TPA: [FeFe] hydrogenase H-cluster maturation GTPase HydF, partial [Clostridia bacterium]|nr:[FeFe] hydrogenase H-cluster maturation GTPase HydF [Clostridia bacterium]